jgi:hypothetical protein
VTLAEGAAGTGTGVGVLGGWSLFGRSVPGAYDAYRLSLGLGLDLVGWGGHFREGLRFAPFGGPPLVLGPLPAPSALLLSLTSWSSNRRKVVRNSPERQCVWPL